MKEPVKLALDIQSPVAEAECVFLANSVEGMVVLEVGSGRGRLTVALTSNAQRVHSVDDHGGDSPFDNTLSDFIGNIKRYRVVDKVIAHVGAMDKAILALDKGVFGAVIVVGAKGLKLMSSNPAFFRSFINNKAVYVHSTEGVPPKFEDVGCEAVMERVFKMTNQRGAK